MSSVEHASFTIERTYDAPPARVFAAFADPAAKAQWFGGENFSLDFRVGGTETNGGRPSADGPLYRYEATYRDIVADERLVYTYDMHMDDTIISVSVAALELAPEGDGTRLTLTEHGAFLDGLDNVAQREQGTRMLLDGLAKALSQAPASA